MEDEVVITWISVVHVVKEQDLMRFKRTSTFESTRTEKIRIPVGTLRQDIVNLVYVLSKPPTRVTLSSTSGVKPGFIKMIQSVLLQAGVSLNVKTQIRSLSTAPKSTRKPLPIQGPQS